MKPGACRFEDQRKETWIPTIPVWLVAVMEQLLELYSDTQFINTMSLDGTQVPDGRKYGKVVIFFPVYCHSVSLG